MKTKNHSNNASFGIDLLELIGLRIGQLNNCSYCITMHLNELKHLGDSELRLYLLSSWKEVPCFTKKEKAVLALTDELSSQSSDEPSPKMLHLLHPYYTDEAIYALSLAIKQINNWTPVMKHY